MANEDNKTSMADVVIIVLALLGFGAAVQSFVAVPLFWKLIGILIGLVLGLVYTGIHLNKRKTAKNRIGTAATFLALPCILSVVVATLVVHYNTVSIEKIVNGNTGELWLRAPVQGVEKLTIRLPSPANKECAPIDPVGSSEHRADALMLDSDSANPQLQISNFLYPQRLGWRCKRVTDLDQVTVRAEPPTAEIFSSDQLRSYDFTIIGIGGVLWLLTLAAFWRRSA